MKRPRHFLIVAALVFCGVSLPAFAVDAAANASATKPARPSLAVGMTAEQVREIAGKPSTIKPVKKEGLKAEIWIYKFDKLAGVKDVATSTRDVLVADPIGGIVKTMPEPVYSQQRTFVVETTEVLMIDGALAGAKRYRSVRNDLDD